MKPVTWFIRSPLHTKIFAGLLLGIPAGLLLGPRAEAIKPIGDLFIRLIWMIVVPLVFSSIFVGTASLGDLRKLGRIGAKTIVYYLVTTAVAITIGLFIAIVFLSAYFFMKNKVSDLTMRINNQISDVLTRGLGGEGAAPESK